eukprot:tig00000523_g1842.t1
MAVVDVMPIEGAFAGLASARSRSSRAVPACAAEAPAPACPGKKRLSAPVMPAAKRGKENAARNSPAAPEAAPSALSLADLAAALAALVGAPAEAAEEEEELAAFEWGPAAPRPEPRGAFFAPIGAADRIAARRAFCPERMFGSAPPAAAVLAC